MSVGRLWNHAGGVPAAKADSKLDAKDGSCKISERKPDGAAVSSTERTGAVGSSEAR